MSRFFLSLTVFVTGMAVMAVELTASRLLAPYFGASLFVWTNLIGVVLLALSLGYYFGGKLADKKGGKLAQKMLFPLILITGILITIIPLVGKPIFLFAYQAIGQRATGIFLSSLIATLILFTIPLLLLGMVTPLAARLGMTKLNTAGSVIGSLYAFSTIGSIVGTFLPVLLTIPFFGSRETFFLFGGILILLGTIGLRRMALLPLLLLPLVLFIIPTAIHANPNLEFEGESIYNYIRVQKGQNGERALLTNEGQGVQSLYHPYRILTGYYWDTVALLPALNPGGKKFLIVGTGGASSARMLHRFFPNLELYGVEIDPLMQKIAEEFFDAGKIPMKVALADGRMFLEHTSEQYDFMMIDVYKDELYIPFHLATKEFFTLVQSRLTGQGSMVMNIAALSSDSDLLQVLRNTVTAVFPYVYEYRAPNSYNSLLFAFTSEPNFAALPLETHSLELRTLLGQILRGIKRVEFDSSRGVALDNRSPIEFLTEKMVFSEALN